jgi:hypothetical protein
MFAFGYVGIFASNRNAAPCEGVRVIEKAMGFLKRKCGSGGSCKQPINSTQQDAS